MYIFDRDCEKLSSPFSPSSQRKICPLLLPLGHYLVLTQRRAAVAMSGNFPITFSGGRVNRDLDTVPSIVEGYLLLRWTRNTAPVAATTA